MAYAGEGGGVSIPPLEPIGGLFAGHETPYSPVSTSEHADVARSQSPPPNGEYQRVLVRSPSMESLRESTISNIVRLSPVPQLLLGNPFSDHSRMDESDDDRSTISGFRDDSSVGHSSAPSIRSSSSVRSTRSTASTIRVKRTFRTQTTSSENNPFSDDNSLLIDHPAPSTAEFVDNPFEDGFLAHSESGHLSSESASTAKKELSRLSSGSAITYLSYEPSEDGTVSDSLSFHAYHLSSYFAQIGCAL